MKSFRPIRRVLSQAEHMTSIPTNPITERQRMIGVYNHLLSKVFTVALPFSEGDWIPRAFGKAKGIQRSRLSKTTKHITAFIGFHQVQILFFALCMVKKTPTSTVKNIDSKTIVNRIAFGGPQSQNQPKQHATKFQLYYFYIRL